MATKAVNPRATIDRVLERFAEERDRLVERVLREVMAIPGYSQLDVGQHEDLRQSVTEVVDAFVGLLVEGRSVTHADVAFLRPHVRRRVLGGVPQADSLAGLRLVQRTFWEVIVRVAGDDERGHAAALELARPLLDYLEAMSQVCAEAFDDVAMALASRRSIIRSELLEELLLGHAPEPGPRLDALRACGLESGPFVVVVGRPVAPPDDEAVLPLGVTTLARAAGDAVEPLGVARKTDVVLIRATPLDDAPRFAESLDAARRKLAGDAVQLAIGMSAVHEGHAAVPTAYGEACNALEHMPRNGGLLALPLMTPLDYLFLRAGDRTAWQLVPPQIRAFIEQDGAEAGLLTTALLTYLDCDMNVKLAAERLCVHPNTAYSRLAKVADRTGCDLRRLDDLSKLLVAIRIHRML